MTSLARISFSVALAAALACSPGSASAQVAQDLTPPHAVLPAPPVDRPPPPEPTAHLGHVYGTAWSGTVVGVLAGAAVGLTVALPLSIGVDSAFGGLFFATAIPAGVGLGALLGAGLGAWLSADTGGIEGPAGWAVLSAWLGPVAGALLGTLFALPFGGANWVLGMSAGSGIGALLLSQLGATLGVALARDSIGWSAALAPLEDGAIGALRGQF